MSFIEVSRCQLTKPIVAIKSGEVALAGGGERAHMRTRLARFPTFRVTHAMSLREKGLGGARRRRGVSRGDGAQAFIR